jgi:hypothetical protein
LLALAVLVTTVPSHVQWPRSASTKLPRTADGKPCEVAFLPWAEATYKERASNGKDHPGAQCLPSGIPEQDTVPHPYNIVQTPDLIGILYEARTVYRQIFTDGRPQPHDPNSAWQGYVRSPSHRSASRH